MKYSERPAWMAPSKRGAAPPRQPDWPAQAERPGQPARPDRMPTEPEPYAVPDPGYNPYDTAVTRASDVWRSKPKRS